MDVPILWFFSDAELFLKLLNQRKTFSVFLFYKPAGVLNAHSPISELSLLVKLFSLRTQSPIYLHLIFAIFHFDKLDF